MLRVAVTGPVGQGKSQLLARLADLLEARGEVAVGLLAEADGPRLGPGAGAKAYSLDPLGPLPEGLPPRPWLWAERWEEASGDRPEWAQGMRYRFFPEAIAQAEAVARHQLALQGSQQLAPSFLLLDEFGKAEAAGGGWLPAWRSAWAQLQAPVLVVAVREGQLEAAAEALGGPWDWVLPAEAPEAWVRLSALATEAKDWRRVGGFGAAGGAFEASVGAWLHGGMLPGRGLVMSSVQAALLTRLARGLAEPQRAAWAGPVAAGLKAFSPAGSRLRPMLAISIQALIFGAVAGLGRGQAWALVAGSALVGAWAAAQGVVFSWLLLGQALWKALEAGRQAAQAWAQGWGAGPWVLPLLDWRLLLAAYVGGWALVTAAAGAAALRGASVGAPELVRRAGLSLGRRGHAAQGPDELALPPEALGQMPDPGAGPGRLKRWGDLLVAWGRELLRPSAWLPLALVLAVLAANGTPWQELVWVVLRAAAIVLVLVALLRRSDLGKLTNWLARKGAWGPALAFGAARQAVALGGPGGASIDPPAGLGEDRSGAVAVPLAQQPGPDGRKGAPPKEEGP